MPTIANTSSTLDGDRDDAAVHGMLQFAWLSRRGLDYIPDLKHYMLSCERARIEARVETNQQWEGQQPAGTAPCRVYTIQVFALRSGSPASKGKDAVARYQLNVDPDSDLGLTLGEALAPHIGLAPPTLSSRHGGVESLLHDLDDAVLDHPTAQWNVAPLDGFEWITEDEIKDEDKIKHLALKFENASQLRVIPSFHEFVNNSLSTCSKFVSTMRTELRRFTLIASLQPHDETGRLELLTQDTSGKVLNREDFTVHLQEPDPNAWLHVIKERVYSLAPENSTEKTRFDEQQSARKLLNHIFDAAAVFNDEGPRGIRRMFSRSADKRDHQGDVTAALSERDLEILRGEINPDANQLSARLEAEREFEPTFGRDPAGSASLINLEIGDRVARVSVHANGRDGSATIAWYLKNKTPFSSGDTTALERMWKAAELLQRNSEGAIYTGLDELCSVSIPKYQGLSDLQDILDFDIDGIPGVVFSPVAPVLLGQMARVVEGIEEIDASVLASHRSALFPGNFQKLRFSLHGDGALSIQAVNAVKGRLTAFIPASGFEERGSSRSDTIQLLSKLLVWHPEKARLHVQDAVKSLAGGAEGWYSSTGSEIDAPGLARDIPPIDAVRGNLAYERAISIAKTFAKIAKVPISSIPISLIGKGSLRPHACMLLLKEPATRASLGIVVDDLGIKTTVVRFSRARGTRGAERLTFVRSSPNSSPFGTTEQLRQFLAEYSRLGDDVRRYRQAIRDYTRWVKEQPHTRLIDEGGRAPFSIQKPVIDFGPLLAHLSQHMKRLRAQ